MGELTQYVGDEFVLAHLCRFYIEVLWDAENSNDVEEYGHGQWLKQAIISKMKEYTRSYN